MIINSANLQFFFSGLNVSMRRAYEDAPTFYDKIATIFPSSTEQEIYAWIGRIEKMRMWRGARITRSPAPQTYLVGNDPFELTIEIDKFKLQDDKQGIYYPLAADLGLQAKKVWDYQLRDLLLNQGDQTGARQNGLDGLTHFNTAHPVDLYDSAKGTYCNNYTGGVSIGGVTTGGALTANGLATVWQDMASRKGEDGEPLGIMADTLIVPPQQKVTAEILCNSAFFSPAAIGSLTGQVGAVDNPLKRFGLNLIVWPELAADPTGWYLTDCSRAIKPFGIQLRQPANFVYRIAETDPAVFDKHMYTYGGDVRGNPMWGPAFLSSYSKP